MSDRISDRDDDQYPTTEYVDHGWPCVFSDVGTISTPSFVPVRGSRLQVGHAALRRLVQGIQDVATSKSLDWMGGSRRRSTGPASIPHRLSFLPERTGDLHKHQRKHNDKHTYLALQLFATNADASAERILFPSQVLYNAYSLALLGDEANQEYDLDNAR